MAEVAKEVLCEWILQSDNSRELSACLDLSSESQSFWRQKSQNIQDLISHVNTALNSSRNRFHGLTILKYLLGQCSSEVFMQNAAKWLPMLLLCLQSHDRVMVKRLACHNIEILLEHAASFAEISRELSTSLIPKLVIALLEAGDQWLSPALRCLCSCMTYYPGPCGSFRGKIETVAISVIDKENSQLASLGAEVYARLTACGGGGNQGVKHTEAWTYQCDRLLASLDHVVAQLFACIQSDSSSTTIDAEPFNLKQIPEEDSSRCIVLAKQFQLLCLYLGKIITVDFPAVAKIPVEDILDIACRSLSVTPKQLVARPTSEKLSLANVIPVLHTAALQLTASLVRSCKKNLISQAATVNQLLLQTLSWSLTQENAGGQQRQYGALRHQVYTTLYEWVVTMGPVCGLHSVMDQLLPHIIADIKPQSDVIKLNTTLTASVQGNRKRKHNGAQGQDTAAITGQKHVDTAANVHVTHAALKGLRCIVYNFGSQLKPKHHKELQELVVRLLLSIHKEMNAPPIPFSDPLCLKELYHVLLALTLVPASRWPSPTQCAIRLFSIGLNDTNLEVSNMCREALASCQAVMHPRMPSIHSPVQLAVVNSSSASGQTSGQQEQPYITSQKQVLSSSTFSAVLPLKAVSFEKSATQKLFKQDFHVRESSSSGMDSAAEKLDNVSGMECEKENEQINEDNFYDQGDMKMDSPPSCIKESSLSRPVAQEFPADTSTDQTESETVESSKGIVCSEKSEVENVESSTVESDLMLQSFVDCGPDSD